MKHNRFAAVQCTLIALVMPVAFLVCLAHAQETSPVNSADVLRPYLSDDLFFVARLDLPTIQAGEWGQLLQFLPPSPSEESQGAVGAVATANRFIQEFHSMGVESAYLLLRIEDIQDTRGWLGIVAVKSGADTTAVQKKLQELSSNFPDRPEIRPQGNNLVLVGSKATLARYETIESAARLDIAEPLDKLASEKVALAAVFAPGKDFRRVLRELWPELPEPMTPATGDLLADGFTHVEVAANVTPRPSLQLTCYSTDTTSAETFAQLIRDLPTAIGQLLEEIKGPATVKRFVEPVGNLLKPQVDDRRVTVRVDSSTLAEGGFFSQALQMARETTHRDTRVTAFKHIALALHNYHDVYKHFPTSAEIRDKEKGIYLSWRVAILPFLDDEAAELYREFHLDEPWDSAHNSQLFKRMPAIYADPAQKQLAAEGKTTYVLPTGPETVFRKDERTQIREITDGTSQTVMLVEVDPLRAVIWTKPDDWEVDLDNPLRGVARSDRDYFTAAYCDGSVRMLPMDIDPETFRKLLTRAGGEVIEWP